MHIETVVQLVRKRPNDMETVMNAENIMQNQSVKDLFTVNEIKRG